jgi:hypothetical protein
MRRTFILMTCLAMIAWSSVVVRAKVKKVPYTKIDVNIEEAYTPDAAFQAMSKSFGGAVARKDSPALFALVGPTFISMSQGAPAEAFDMGRDALHNFKVLFGFREVGKDTDGGVQDGPFWEALASFAQDGTYYKAADNLVCSPILGMISEEKKFEDAQKKIAADETVSWYFTFADNNLTKGPTDATQVGKFSKQVLPVLSVYPPRTGEEPAPPVTHLEVLIPTGKTGWIPLSAARPLETDRLCYAATPSGQWRIVLYDQAG